MSSGGGLKREERMGGSVTELESLTRGHQIEYNSADNLKISGSLSVRIAETLIYGKRKAPAVGFEIGKIKSDTRFLQKSEEWRAGQKINIKKKKKVIIKVEKLKTRLSNLHLQWE